MFGKKLATHCGVWGVPIFGGALAFSLHMRRVPVYELDRTRHLMPRCAERFSSMATDIAGTAGVSIRAVLLKELRKIISLTRRHIHAQGLMCDLRWQDAA